MKNKINLKLVRTYQNQTISEEGVVKEAITNIRDLFNIGTQDEANRLKRLIKANKNVITYYDIEVSRVVQKEDCIELWLPEGKKSI